MNVTHSLSGFALSSMLSFSLWSTLGKNADVFLVIQTQNDGIILRIFSFKSMEHVDTSATSNTNSKLNTTEPICNSNIIHFDREQLKSIIN